MNKNSVAIVEKEMASQHIEGVDFGSDVWVVARSPVAVLIWVKGHSWSVNGHQRYSAGHLMGLPDRSPRAAGNLQYQRLWEGEGRRFTWRTIENCQRKIDHLFEMDDIWHSVRDAVRQRKTLLIEGGAGQLRPVGIFGHAYNEWRDRGGGFLVLPEGMTEHEACRGKLGWKPLEKSQ